MFKFNLDRKNSVLLIILIGLIISNVVFYGLLVRYYFYHHPSAMFFWDVFNNILSIVSAIILLGFISTHLPKFREIGDSSIYEIGYLVVIGLMSIVVSYFNKSTHSEALLDPFIDVFKVLSILLILLFIATKTSSFKRILHDNGKRKDFLYVFIIFAILGCLASMYQIPVHDSMVTVRELVVMISGMFAGPVVGIPVALISGVFRFLYGGTTAIPCSLSTVIAGIIGSVIYICNGHKLPRSWQSVILMFLFTGFSMFLILALTPQNISIPYVNGLYPLMLFASVVGIILFKIIIKEEETVGVVSPQELRIRELENKVNLLQDDIELLKNGKKSE